MTDFKFEMAEFKNEVIEGLRTIFRLTIESNERIIALLQKWKHDDTVRLAREEHIRKLLEKTRI